MRGFWKAFEAMMEKTAQLFSVDKQTQHVGDTSVGIQCRGNVSNVTISNIDVSNNGESSIEIGSTTSKNTIGIKTKGGRGNGLSIRDGKTVVNGQEIEVRGVRIVVKDNATVELEGDEMVIYADDPKVTYRAGFKPAGLNITIKPAKP